MHKQILEVFCHVLIGNLDRGILNYLLYLAEIIDKIEWIHVDDVKLYFAIVYPFCDVSIPLKKWQLLAKELLNLNFTYFYQGRRLG